MKYTGTPVDAVDKPVPYEASTVSSFQRFSTVFDRMQEFDDAYVCALYNSRIHPVGSEYRHSRVYASSQRGAADP
jgi:hypothetical protein